LVKDFVKHLDIRVIIVQELKYLIIASPFGDKAVEEVKKVNKEEIKKRVIAAKFSLPAQAPL